MAEVVEQTRDEDIDFERKIEVALQEVKAKEKEDRDLALYYHLCMLKSQKPTKEELRRL